MIINYQVFHNNQNFIDWQNNLTKDISILEMVPVTVYEETYHTVNDFAGNINHNVSEKHNSIGIFVTYTEND